MQFSRINVKNGVIVRLLGEAALQPGAPGVERTIPVRLVSDGGEGSSVVAGGSGAASQLVPGAANGRLHGSLEAGSGRARWRLHGLDSQLTAAGATCGDVLTLAWGSELLGSGGGDGDDGPSPGASAGRVMVARLQRAAGSVSISSVGPVADNVGTGGKVRDPAKAVPSGPSSAGGSTAAAARTAPPPPNSIPVTVSMRNNYQITLPQTILGAVFTTKDDQDLLEGEGPLVPVLLEVAGDGAGGPAAIEQRLAAAKAAASSAKAPMLWRRSEGTWCRFRIERAVSKLFQLGAQPGDWLQLEAVREGSGGEGDGGGRIIAVLARLHRLRELGVDSVLSVPTLVIAGDQSSGKSSVVEAVAGVALPRSDGTCTRCPTEVRMRTVLGASAAGPWVCRIKLCRDYDDEGKPLLEKPAEELFCTVTDKSQLTACVTAAQAVLLNPKAVLEAPGGAGAFVPNLSSTEPKQASALQALGSASNYQLMFTANKVVLEIDGAEADLTIIDLPGIIHDHPKGKQYVEMVERMTRACLAPENHIIAMALPAGLDPETQAIRLWVREADPSGHRSIGIITKPDTLAADAHIANRKLVDLVCGRHEGAGQGEGYMHLGYYVVKNPSQEQLQEGISFAGARKAEESYFTSSPHWAAAVATSQHLRARLGTRNLRTGLSSLLVERIEAQLPAIRRNAREQLMAINKELAEMPPAPSEDALMEIRTLVSQAAEALERHVHAKSDTGDKTFYQTTKKLYKEYGQQVIRSTPAFLVGWTLITALSSEDKSISPLGDGLQEAAGELDLSKRKLKDKPEADASSVLQSLTEELARSLYPEKHMTLEQIRELCRRHEGRELPGFSPYSAVEDLIRQHKGQWASHADECLEAVEDAVRGKGEAVLAETLGRYPKALRAIGTVFSDYVEELTAEAGDKISSLVGIEDADTFTLNQHYFAKQHAFFLGRLKKAYVQPKALSNQEEEQVKDMLGKLKSFGVSFSSYDDLFMAQVTDADEELRMMAACLAYFKVAFKRVQDGVPLLIRDTLLRRLADRHTFETVVLKKAGLASGLGPEGLAASDAARSLLEEDQALAARRMQLQDMKRRLQEAMAVLHAPAV
ncbi:hypothetical protein GPECTOR_10g931 [Gonium pectorale]|uniref:GED domain-containing protein n=1 Tax=Gonium pectorale TaxID=33097 RepID=A0A150GR34_GONPE|nr:hypothetical protein GPECTOR_10g931 [Gonium pectorale]|eukprot:KXZ52299.1 hypothetical protein GPECTOR_10g931 [Gonium pectorale]